MEGSRAVDLFSFNSKMSTTPTTYKQIRVKQHSTNFREATEFIDVPFPTEIGADQVLVKTAYVALNASDVNLCSGVYGAVAPFTAGFEAMGEVVKVGSAVTHLQVGSAVYYWGVGGAFSEYILTQAATVFPIPSMDPGYITCFVSGCTASVAYEMVGELKWGQTTLVTTAAGGTGQFAVQLAKMAGNHVIGTCGSDDKIEFLKSIGCDRVINYKKEDLGEVLKKEYPKGVDVVYECVGGKTMDAAVDNIALHGRIIVIGSTHSYLNRVFEQPDPTALPIGLKLLWKTASLRGFFLGNHFSEMPAHSKALMDLYRLGKIKVATDCPYKGIERIPEAIDYMYEGKNIGKIIVDLRN